MNFIKRHLPPATVRWLEFKRLRSQPKKSAALTLCLGVMFLFPPVILIFTKPVSIFGIPVSVIYLFGVWAALIVFSGLLSTHLNDPPE